MSKFHFDEGTMNSVATTLGNINENIKSGVIPMNDALLMLYNSEGFNISYAISTLKEEITNVNSCIEKTERAKHLLDDTARIVRMHTGNATIVDVAQNINDQIIDKIIASKKENNGSVVLNGNSSEGNKSGIDTIDLQALVVPEFINLSDGNYTAKQNNDNTVIIEGKDINGESYFFLSPTNEKFIQGSHWGYIQTTQEGLDGWFASNRQCVATSKATTDMYNGVNKTPLDWYSLGYNDGGWDGGSNFPCWRMLESNQLVFEYCMEQLNMGRATTIYAYKSNGNFENGHALTVIGYMNGGNGIGDLIVVNPWNGSCVRLGDTDYYWGNNGYNGNFECSENLYAF